MAGKNEKNPVLLLHGYIMSPLSAWPIMWARLRLDGHKCYTMFLKGIGLRDIRFSAEKTRKKVEKILARTGAKKIDLIGHSEGGMVARYYIQRFGGDKYVERCITLGTPHGGTFETIIVVLTTAGRQLLPLSSLIRDLNKNGIPKEVKWTSIYSIYDECVIPWWSAHLFGAENKLIYWPPVFHVNMLYYPHVYNLVMEALEK